MLINRDLRVAKWSSSEIIRVKIGCWVLASINPPTEVEINCGDHFGMVHKTLLIRKLIQVGQTDETDT